MSIRRLRTLVAVAEQGSFAGAAETVFLSQAAVSMQMKSLEEELETVLFDRSKRPPELNPVGRALVPKAREIVSAYDTMVRSIHDEDRLMGELTIGAIPTTMTGLVPQAISALKATYPDLHLRVSPGLSGDLMPQIDRGHLDAAVVSEPLALPHHLLWHPFAEEPLIVLASLQTPTDDPEQLLEGFPFIRFNRQAWVGRLIDDWLQKSGIRVQEHMELDTLEAISTMVYHNLGVSIVPQRCVPSPHPLPLKRIPLGPTAPARIVGVLVRRDSAKSRLVDVFLAELVRLVETAGQVRALGRDLPREP